jgi:hypothetical protein
MSETKFQKNVLFSLYFETSNLNWAHPSKSVYNSNSHRLWTFDSVCSLSSQPNAGCGISIHSAVHTSIAVLVLSLHIHVETHRINFHYSRYLFIYLTVRPTLSPLQFIWHAGDILLSLWWSCQVTPYRPIVVQWAIGQQMLIEVIKVRGESSPLSHIERMSHRGLYHGCHFPFHNGVWHYASQYLSLWALQTPVPNISVKRLAYNLVWGISLHITAHFLYWPL